MRHHTTAPNGSKVCVHTHSFTIVKSVNVEDAPGSHRMTRTSRTEWAQRRSFCHDKGGATPLRCLKDYKLRATANELASPRVVIVPLTCAGGVTAAAAVLVY